MNYFLKSFLIFISSLVVVGFLYREKFIYFGLPFGAILIPLGLIAIYQKYICKPNTKGYVFSVIMAMIVVAFGCFIFHVSWVHSTGNWNNFFNADGESKAVGLFFNTINLLGTLLVGIIYSLLNAKK
ncbi:MAG: hypothetical protein K0S34_1018 [Bacillales bacterium]|jgi:hypothetical protein|nr:hypothetical protein [Bacillales bacterium]